MCSAYNLHTSPFVRPHSLINYNINSSVLFEDFLVGDDGGGVPGSLRRIS